MRFLKRPEWLKWPKFTDETVIRFFFSLLFFFIGTVVAGALDAYQLENAPYQVFSEANPSPWIVKGLPGAEKKAHWLVYGCDCKLAIIMDTNGKVMDQVRNGDGRDVK